MLAQRYPDALVIRSRNNAGGAGGFAKGISYAAHSYDYAWLMDDDAIPEETCLELLLQPFDRYGYQHVAFSCPQVTDASGNTGPRNYPVPTIDFPEIYRMASDSWLPVSAATFVGPLINLKLAKLTHAPLEDFFIWHDDFEYTTRLARRGAGVSVPAAHIMHLAANPGPDHYNASRNREHVRNLVWWWRELGKDDAAAQRRLGLRILLSMRHQFLLAPQKLQYFRVVLSALREGIFTAPRHRGFEEIRQESSSTDVFLRGLQQLNHA